MTQARAEAGNADAQFHLTEAFIVVEKRAAEARDSDAGMQMRSFSSLSAPLPLY